MPWHAHTVPSIQLGILQSELERSGVSCRSHHLYLDFADFVVREGLLALEDYQLIGDFWFMVAPGEWAFALPPVRAASEGKDRAYFELLRSKGVPELLLDRLVEVRQRVPEFLDRCADEILAGSPQMVGFTTTFGQVIASLALAHRIKARAPDMKIVFGGANCEGEMGEALLLSYPQVDVVVRGEGEAVVVELARAVVAGAPIPALPGFCYRQDRELIVVPPARSQVAMDTVPVPDYDDYFERRGRLPALERVTTVIPFESSRGCWWGEKSHCSFCGINGTAMAYRSKPASRVVHDLVALSSRYDALDFVVVDNILDMKYFATVLPELRARRLDLRLFYQTKANLKRDEIRMLYDAGVRSIRPGIESLSTPTLNLMRKGVTALQNVRLLRWCAEQEIHVAWSVLYGLPGEDPAECARVAALIPALVHLCPPSLAPLTLDRFSPYFERSDEHGLEVLGPPVHYPLLYDLEEETLAELAWTFEYRLADGARPETYARGLREQVIAWRETAVANRNALTYRCGPTFIEITDRRTTCGNHRFVLDQLEACIYLGCLPGQTAKVLAAEATALLGRFIAPAQVTRILDEFAHERLVIRESDRYLALAIPEDRQAASANARTRAGVARV